MIISDFCLATTVKSSPQVKAPIRPDVPKQPTPTRGSATPQRSRPVQPRRVELPAPTQVARDAGKTDLHPQLRSHLQPGPKDHVVDVKEPRKTRSGLVLGKKNVGAMMHSTGER